MSGKYIKPLVEVAKAQGPKAVKVIRENPKEIMAVLGAVKVVKTKFDERKKKKVEEGKIPLRKERFDEFNKSILKNLNDYNREQLFNYKLEVKEFIEQIDKEMAEETKAKKPLHVKRRKNWEALLTQIDSKLKTKDYGEYVKYIITMTMLVYTLKLSKEMYKDSKNLVKKVIQRKLSIF